MRLRPDAGFLCAEPLFNKPGANGAAGNAKAHLESLSKPFGKDGPSSRLVALELSDARARWVVERAGGARARWSCRRPRRGRRRLAVHVGLVAPQARAPDHEGGGRLELQRPQAGAAVMSSAPARWARGGAGVLAVARSC